jgi:NAD(P)-dependent dehydrogenase (short-subunit alcohol dehydrogenase family)
MTSCGYVVARPVSTRLGAFAGRVAVVTGVGSGIGRALTYGLAARGAALAVSDINDSQLAVTAQDARSLGATVLTKHLDVTDRPAMLSYAEEVVTHFGAAHIVINNAGVAHIGDVLGMQFSDIERVIDINFWGVVNGTMAFLPHLIASGDGHLVNISSLFGLIPIPNQSAYVASKFAVRGFTESLRCELAPAGVGVTCVHPGGVRTNIARNAIVGTRLPAAQWEAGRDAFDRMLTLDPADAAAAILRAVHRRRPRVLVGRDAVVLDKIARLLPVGNGRLLAAAARRGARR